MDNNEVDVAFEVLLNAKDVHEDCSHCDAVVRRTLVSHALTVKHERVLFTACKRDKTGSLSEIHLYFDCATVRVYWLTHFQSKVAPESD